MDFTPDYSASPEKKEEVVPFDLSGKRALLVEDNDLNLEIAEALILSSPARKP